MTRIVLIAAIMIAVFLYGVSYYIDKRDREVVDKITIAIVEQEKTLSNIAEITDRDGADAVVESIIRDCSTDNRSRFDSLLDRLGQLSPSELSETKALFDSCARFFSSRKALMIARMEREYEVYRDMVELLAIIDDEITVSQFRVGEWDNLVVLEKKRSDIFERQVSIQLEIINALVAGDRVGSENIQGMLTEAQNISEEALVVNQQIDTLRGDLLDL